MSDHSTVQHDNEPQGTTRRAFHLAVVYVLGALIALGMAIPTILYLLVPPKGRRSSGFIDAGDISDLTPGTPKEVSVQRNQIDGWRVETATLTAWVVKQPDNSVVAYGPSCTHLGCAVHWDSDQKEFICPCHNSVFGADGKVVSGPAPRPLDRYVTKIENNRLQIGDLKQSNA